MAVFRGHGIRVVLGPFTNRLAFEVLDVTDYKGCAGGFIALQPTDNIELARVLVTIRADDDGVIERGEAQWDPGGSRWLFAAQRDLPERQGIGIEVLAVAPPGIESASFGVRDRGEACLREVRAGGETRCVKSQR